MNDPADPIGVALVVTRDLDELGIAHTIGGSIASSVAGEPRSTIDIDIVVAMEERHVAALVAALSSSFTSMVKRYRARCASVQRRT